MDKVEEKQLSEVEMFNLPKMYVAPDTEIFRFNCTLLVSYKDQSTERIGKRRYYVNELRGQGYIGFDAYNHCVKQESTDRIRITYIGKDYLILFVRSPAQGNEPHMHRVDFDHNGLEIKKDCGNGVVYTLITTIKRVGE